MTGADAFSADILSYLQQLVQPASACLKRRHPSATLLVISDHEDVHLPANANRGPAQQARDLAALPSALVNISGVKPITALKRLKCEFEMHPEKRRQFDVLARASAVMGNCPKSRDSFRSGCDPESTHNASMYLADILVFVMQESTRGAYMQR